eukprot:5523575-Pyramimonas_sp.AAC.1
METSWEPHWIIIEKPSYGNAAGNALGCYMEAWWGSVLGSRSKTVGTASLGIPSKPYWRIRQVPHWDPIGILPS